MLDEVMLQPVEVTEKFEVVMDKREKEKLKSAAQKRNLSMSRFARIAILEKIKRMENGSKTTNSRAG